MKHKLILDQLVQEWMKERNILGVLVFGSCARGDHRPDSDIDVMLVYRSHKPTSGIEDLDMEGIKVGKAFFTFDVLKHSVYDVPYLLHFVSDAKLLFDREGTIQPLLDELQACFQNNPDVVEDWKHINMRFKHEKERYGYEKTTLMEVWNELEGSYSEGEIKRTFFRQYDVLIGSQDCEETDLCLLGRITLAGKQLVARVTGSSHQGESA